MRLSAPTPFYLFVDWLRCANVSIETDEIVIKTLGTYSYTSLSNFIFAEHFAGFFLFVPHPLSERLVLLVGNFLVLIKITLSEG
jgi:hypothetical protein